MWLPLVCPLLGTWPATQAYALTGNRTDDPLLHSPALSLLSHTSQGPGLLFDTSNTCCHCHTSAKVPAMKVYDILVDKPSTGVSVGIRAPNYAATVTVQGPAFQFTGTYRMRHSLIRSWHLHLCQQSHHAGSPSWAYAKVINSNE